MYVLPDEADQCQGSMMARRVTRRMADGSIPPVSISTYQHPTNHTATNVAYSTRVLNSFTIVYNVCMVPATHKSQFFFNYLKKNWSWNPHNLNEICVRQQGCQCTTLSQHICL